VSQVIDEMQAFYLCTMSWLAGILKVLDLIVIIAIIHAGLLQEAAPVKAPPSGDLQLGNRTAELYLQLFTFFSIMHPFFRLRVLR